MILLPVCRAFLFHIRDVLLSRRSALPVISLLPVLVISGCGSTSIKGPDYLTQTPALDIGEFFDGSVKAWGIVQNRKGKVVQRFTATIEGTRTGDTLVLDETFEYGFGEGPATRVWELNRLSNGQWSGSANDVFSEASGAEYGNAFNWRYQMDLPRGDSGRTVRVWFDDWIWAMDEDTVVNRSYIKKFGITFAEVTLFMRKQ